MKKIIFIILLMQSLAINTSDQVPISSTIPTFKVVYAGEFTKLPVEEQNYIFEKEYAANKETGLKKLDVVTENVQSIYQEINETMDEVKSKGPWKCMRAYHYGKHAGSLLLSQTAESVETAWAIFIIPEGDNRNDIYRILTSNIREYFKNITTIRFALIYYG